MLHFGGPFLRGWQINDTHLDVPHPQSQRNSVYSVFLSLYTTSTFSAFICRLSASSVASTSPREELRSKRRIILTINTTRSFGRRLAMRQATRLLPWLALACLLGCACAAAGGLTFMHELMICQQRRLSDSSEQLAVVAQIDSIRAGGSRIAGALQAERLESMRFGACFYIYNVGRAYTFVGMSTPRS